MNLVIKMKKEFYMRANNLFWTFHWTHGEKPIVCFSNPKVFTNVIYSLEDILSILLGGEAKNYNTEIPRRVLQDAYNVMKTQLSTKIAA